MKRIKILSAIVCAVVMLVSGLFVGQVTTAKAQSKKWVSSFGFNSQKIYDETSSISYEYQTLGAQTWSKMTKNTNGVFKSKSGASFFNATWDPKQLVLSNSIDENISLTFHAPVDGIVKIDWFILGTWGDPNNSKDFAMKVEKNEEDVPFTCTFADGTISVDPVTKWTKFTKESSPISQIIVDPTFSNIAIKKNDVLRLIFNAGDTFEPIDGDEKGMHDNKIFYNLNPLVFTYLSNEPLIGSDLDEEILLPPEPIKDPDSDLVFTDKKQTYQHSTNMVSRICKPYTLEDSEFDTFAGNIDDGPLVWQYTMGDNMATNSGENVDDLSFAPKYLDMVAYSGANGETNGLRLMEASEKGWFFETNRISFVANAVYDQVISVKSPNSGKATLLFSPVTDGNTETADLIFWSDTTDGIRIQVLLNGKPLEIKNIPKGFTAPDSQEEYAKGYLYLNPKDEDTCAIKQTGSVYRYYKFLPSFEFGDIYKNDVLSVRISVGLAGNGDSDNFLIDPTFIIDGDGIVERPIEEKPVPKPEEKPVPNPPKKGCNSSYEINTNISTLFVGICGITIMLILLKKKSQFLK